MIGYVTCHIFLIYHCVFLCDAAMIAIIATATLNILLLCYDANDDGKV